MKQLIKGFFRMFGIEVSRYRRPVESSSKRTRNLTYHATVTGNFYLPTDAREDVVANAIIANQVFDEAIVRTAEQYIRKNTVVLDVGANFGQMSVLFSRMVEGGKVYSFEADDWIMEILRKNIEANGKENTIVPVFGAVFNTDGQTMFYPEQDFVQFGTYGSYGVDYAGKQGREVRSLTIDSLDIREPVSFMKIDIQGGDLQAMQGAVRTIERNRMPILFEYEYLFEEKLHLRFQEYVDFVRSINYRFEKVINGHNYLILPN